MNTRQLESKNNSKSATFSIIMHSVLLLIAFFWMLRFEVEPPDPPIPVMDLDFQFVQEIKKTVPPRVERVKPVVKEFTEETSNSTKANADEGESRPINPEVQKVEVNDPKPAPPAETKVETPPTAPNPTPPSTTPIKTTNDSPVKVKDTDVNIDKPTKENVPPKAAEPSKPTTTTSPAPKTTTTSGQTTTKPVPTGAGTVGSPTGTGTKPQSQTDGHGKGKSTTGDGLGSGKGDDVTSGTGNASDGTGDYDGSGNGIFKRRVIYKNWANLPMTKSGKVAVKTCINRSGIVTFTEIVQTETTIKDRAILKQTLKAAKGYKYEADPKAPAEQCGKLLITLEIPGALRAR